MAVEVFLIEAGDPADNHWSSLVIGKNCGVVGLIGNSKVVLASHDVRDIVLAGDMKLGLVDITDGDSGHCRASDGSSSVVVGVEGSTVSVDISSSDPGSVVVDIDLTGVCKILLSRLLVGQDLVDGDVPLELDVTRASVVAGPLNPDSLVVDVTVDVVMLETDKLSWLFQGTPWDIPGMGCLTPWFEPGIVAWGGSLRVPAWEIGDNPGISGLTFDVIL